MDCLLVLLLFLTYPLLQGYALYRLRDGLRRFAWFILIFVVLFSCLMFGTLFATDNSGYRPGVSVVQAVMILMAWLLSSLLLLVLLLFHGYSSPKPLPPPTEDIKATKEE